MLSLQESLKKFLICRAAPAVVAIFLSVGAARCEISTGDIPDKQAAAFQSLDTKSGAILKAGISNIEEYNRQIILKEIELERFSINFRKNNNVQGRWRGWRYFASQEANSAMTAAGLTVQISDRLRVARKANLLTLNKAGVLTYKSNVNNRITLEKGQILQLTGQSIGALGAALELGININHQMEAYKKGYGPRASIKHVLALRHNIDALFAERRQAIAAANLDIEERLIADSEEKVLRDLTDMGLQEYVGYHSTARRFRAFQDTQYILDFAKSSSGATGSLLNLLATHNRRPRQTGAAGIVSTASGALIMLAPLVSRGVGKIVASIHNRDLAPIADGVRFHTIDELEADRAKLNKLIAARQITTPSSDKSLALLETYDHETEQRYKQFALDTREIRSGTRSATQNIGAGLAVGGTKVAFGVTNIIAGYEFSKFPHKANAVVNGGSIAYAAGSYLAVGDNIRLRLLDELNRKKLSTQGQLPSQILNEKLKSLDRLEAGLKICTGP